MLAAVFGFGGRLNRLRYFLSCLALGGVFGVLAVIAVIGLLAGHSGGAPVSEEDLLKAFLPLAIFAIPAFGAYLWISLSLQARRIRDIGWNPVYVIPGWIGLMIVDRGVALAVPSLALTPHGGTLLGGLFNLAMGAALLFWPSAGPSEPRSPANINWEFPDEPRTPATIRRVVATKVAAPIAAEPVRAAPVRTINPGPPAFGRRGLS
jgi:uncharacterized membrane protein YhaH (DUF805 family)